MGVDENRGEKSCSNEVYLKAGEVNICLTRWVTISHYLGEEEWFADCVGYHSPIKATPWQIPLEGAGAKDGSESDEKVKIFAHSPKLEESDAEEQN